MTIHVTSMLAAPVNLQYKRHIWRGPDTRIKWIGRRTHKYWPRTRANMAIELRGSPSSDFNSFLWWILMECNCVNCAKYQDIAMLRRWSLSQGTHVQKGQQSTLYSVLWLEYKQMLWGPRRGCDWLDPGELGRREPWGWSSCIRGNLCSFFLGYIV